MTTPRYARSLQKRFPDIEIQHTRGGHLVALVHGRKVFLSATPSDGRAIANAAAAIRRAQRGAHP
jgi:predicted DNA-binding transcriptional regulator YafY